MKLCQFVFLSSNIIYISNDHDILIYDINDLSNPNEVGIIETSNAIKDLDIENNLLYVAIGSDGVNVYDITDLYNPLYLNNFNTGTMANRISTFNDKLAVSDWEDIDILEWNGQALIQVGYKNTGKRTMAIATKNEFIYSAEWASIQAFKYGTIQEPDIDLSTWELNFPYVENGNSYSLSVEIINNGNEILINSDNYTTNSEFQIINPLESLNPGETQIIEIIYNASSTTYTKNFWSVCSIYDGSADPTLNNWFSAGYFNTTSALTHIQFKMASGNLNAGKIKMYGIV